MDRRVENPFSQLRFRNTDVQVWGIQITRDIARNREKQLFSFTPKDEAGGIAQYGHLVGIRGLTRSPLLGPKGNVEFLAWLQIPSKTSDSVALMISRALGFDG